MSTPTAQTMPTAASAPTIVTALPALDSTDAPIALNAILMDYVLVFSPLGSLVAVQPITT